MAFWVDVLGAELDRTFALEGNSAADVTGVAGARINAAVVLLGDHRIELLEYLEPAERDARQPRPNVVGSWHLALDVTDLDRVVARCGERGWRLAGSEGTMRTGPRAGTRFAYLHDQDGATLELIEAPSLELAGHAPRSDPRTERPTGP